VRVEGAPAPGRERLLRRTQRAGKWSGLRPERFARPRVAEFRAAVAAKVGFDRCSLEGAPAPDITTTPGQFVVSSNRLRPPVSLPAGQIFGQARRPSSAIAGLALGALAGFSCPRVVGAATAGFASATLPYAPSMSLT